jgi:hypothetical protein
MLCRFKNWMSFHPQNYMRAGGRDGHVETGMSSEETAPQTTKERAGSMDYLAEFFRGLNHEPVEDFGW